MRYPNQGISTNNKNKLFWFSKDKYFIGTIGTIKLLERCSRGDLTSAGSSRRTVGKSPGVKLIVPLEFC